VYVINFGRKSNIQTDKIYYLVRNYISEFRLNKTIVPSAESHSIENVSTFSSQCHHMISLPGKMSSLKSSRFKSMDILITDEM
jgi:hypothetical protein